MIPFCDSYRMEGRKVLPCKDEVELSRAITNRWSVKTKVGDDEVSTVFLCLNHNFVLGAPPLVFETMVFPQQEVCVRYSTFEDAVVGHNRIVEKLRREKWEKDTVGQRYDDPVGLSDEERKEKLDAMVDYYRKTLKEDGDEKDFN